MSKQEEIILRSPEISDGEDTAFTADTNQKKLDSILISSDDDSALTQDMSKEIMDISSSGADSKVTKSTIIKNLFGSSKISLPEPNPKPKDNKYKQTNGSYVKRTFVINVGLDQPTPSTSVPVKVEPPVTGHSLSIGGVEVHFPVKPYSCQIALMFKVITGIKKCQNGLLESPTGSGKTLALLCGALAWQRKERARIAAEANALYFSGSPERHGGADPGAAATTEPDLASLDQLFAKPVFGEKSIYGCSTPQRDAASPVSRNKRQEPSSDSPDSPEKGLVTLHKRRKADVGSSASSGSGPATPIGPSTPERPCAPPAHAQETPKAVSLPTIYYGARTHKQIQQVIKEFSRTAYAGEAKMTILSSRDYSCIRPFDRNVYKSKNDMCRAVVKKQNESRIKPETACKYFDNKHALHHGSLPAAFDLEELVAAGQRTRACPYYAARNMAASAHIVFCPYNYLIDPGIRSSMQINVTDGIVILDEAHNIEDVCRESASLNLSRTELVKAMSELENVSMYSIAELQDTIQFLLRALKDWDSWFHNQKPLLDNKAANGNELVHTWDVKHFVETLDNHNIGIMQFPGFSEGSARLCRQLREDAEVLKGVSQATGSLLESMATVFGYLYRDSCQYMDDFKPVLVQTISQESESLPDANGWRSSQFNKTVKKEDTSLRLLCMNPGVVFSGLATARTIILSSGTLTPIVSMHSELGSSFPLALSTAHVIPRDRVWVGSLLSSAAGLSMECTARGAARVDTQDALGSAVRWVAGVTPNGMLCFLPSYSLLNSLIKRWQETGLWKELNSVKNLFTESRNVRDHNDVMQDYYSCVGSDKGALLFAVYRGKVSEGMDFKDHQARAVITIGIPYPSMYEMMVSNKMKYNDVHRHDRRLLPSSEWLRVQAYRALNQAVGRCVRHRGDWGAVLMIDARFQQPYYTEHLSKWVRDFLGDNHLSWSGLVHGANSLESFMQNMTIRDAEDL